jgi:hypothetical protein
VATTFATQPVCNAAWAAHALRLDQYFESDIQEEQKISMFLQVYIFFKFAALGVGNTFCTFWKFREEN